MSLNLYTYCNNNPISYTDPDGHEPILNDHLYENLTNEEIAEVVSFVIGFTPADGGKDALDLIAGKDIITQQSTNRGVLVVCLFTPEIVDKLLKNGAKVTKAIVVGETMPDIKTVAKQLQSEGINAKWYQAWGKNFPSERRMTEEELNAALARNQRWIDSKIKQGYTIYDIGIDPKKLESQRSPFYKLEQERLQKYNYPTIDIREMRP